MPLPSAGPRYASGERIEHIVAAHAASTPGRVAVQQGDETLSFGELQERGHAVAAALRASGIGPGDYVPVLMERSPQLVVTLLGVLSAGAAYIAMDPAWPLARTEDVVRRGATCPVLVGDGLERGLAPHPWISADALAAASPTRGVELPRFTDGGSAACVFFTSGSTGRPKGVVSPHRGTIRTVVDCPTIPLDGTTAFLQAAPVPWDAFALELWAPLLNGGRVVLMPRRTRVLDVEALREAVLGQGANSLFLTSSLFSVLTDEAPELLGRLRLLLVGGERVSVPHARTILHRFPGLRLVNGYGPAESTIFATTHVIGPADVADDSEDIPIGRPVPCTGVALLEPGTERLTTGPSGEIALSGDGLAAGYLGDPRETARRFFVHDGVRYYRTGDLAVRDESGVLRYRGRTDQQFKMHGLRIEPGEVERVLEDHPGIGACCVLRLERVPGRPELACLYTTSHESGPDGEALRAFAARVLLGPMVPTLLRAVGRLPLGSTGKLDRAGAAVLLTGILAQEEREAGARHAQDTADDGASDPLLCEVRALLGLPGAGGGDDLIRLGATSLDAVRLADRVGGRFGARITVGDVYRLRSLDALREYGRVAPRGASSVPVGTAVREGPLPLTHAQRRFWMSEQAAPGDADNMLVLAYRLRGSVVFAALGAALRDVVARHPALRTVYRWGEDFPFQQVLDADAVVVPLEQVDPGGLGAGPHNAGPADPASVARQVTRDWWRRPFSLEEEIPLRARWCRLDDGSHLLCLHLHHIAFDGHSESVLVRDLGTAYAARLEGRTPDFGPGTPPSYVDYAAWEDARMSDWSRQDLPFWRRTLAGAPPPVLPAPSGAGEAPRSESVLRLSAETVAGLARTAARHGGPPLAALLAATGRAVAATFGTSDVCLGTATAGRFDPALDPVVGYFVNPLVIPLDGSGHLPAAELLARAAEGVTDALQHARTPFDDLVRALRPARGRHPWFQVWVVLQQRAPHGEFVGGVDIEAIRVPPPTTALELMVEALPQPDGSWEVVLLWRADGIGAAEAGRLRETVAKTLEELAVPT
ncbi:amino acid adenylation domain-containing protein [Streptomyces sp. NPDC059104]|uniref:amino acid adenylation domain-containing protein n=1 Tax=Streptomyces sp. NPDC059104 TaxID=3346729 RepID=UPI003689BFB3